MSGLGEMGNLLKQAQEMQRQLDKVRQEMRTKIIEGTAGGGVIRVRVTADRHEVEGVDVLPDVLKSANSEELREMILAALRDALKRAVDTEKEALGQVTGGMNLPGMF